jgi:hypothetical protein
MRSFCHLVEIDEQKKELMIYRVEGDGTKVLYTSTSLPEVDVSTNVEVFQQFALQLGENILLDSPAVRQLYGI